MQSIRLLVVTSEWPKAQYPVSGVHIVNQVRKLREAGLVVEVFPFWGQKNPLRYLMTILEFRKLDFARFDLIHAHHGQSGIVALAQRRLPVVVTLHGSDILGIRNAAGKITFQGRILIWISRLVARLADEVILVSEKMKSQLPPGNYHVIPVGVDTGLFRPGPQDEARQRLGLPAEEKIALFVGQKDRREKRYWLAQAAVEAVKADCRPRLLAAEKFAHAEMPDYMNAADLLLVTSSTEGSPLAVREALACNLPIVSVDVGDIRQRIEGVPGCRVCPDERPQMIAHEIEMVLQVGKRIDGQAAIRELTEERLLARTIELYSNLIHRKPTS